MTGFIDNGHLNVDVSGKGWVVGALLADVLVLVVVCATPANHQSFSYLLNPAFITTLPCKPSSRK